MADELRQHLLLTALGQMSLRKFCNWFVPWAWDVEDETVSGIKLVLAELSVKHRTTEDVRRYFGRLVAVEGYAVNVCSNCHKAFVELESEPFVTCHACRNPLPRSGLADGCHYWLSCHNSPEQTVKDMRETVK